MNYQARGFFLSSFLHLAFILIIVFFTKSFKEPQRVIALDLDIIKKIEVDKGLPKKPIIKKEKQEKQRVFIQENVNFKQGGQEKQKAFIQENMNFQGEVGQGEAIESNLDFGNNSEGRGGKGIGGGEGENIQGGINEGIQGGTNEGIQGGTNEGIQGEIFEASRLDRQLKIISYILPKYPKEAKENGIKGIVKIRLLINAEGQVEEARIIEENPKGFGFGEEALKVVKDYRFDKPTILGRPVSVYYILPLRFSLED